MLTGRELAQRSSSTSSTKSAFAIAASDGKRQAEARAAELEALVAKMRRG